MLVIFNQNTKRIYTGYLGWQGTPDEEFIYPSDREWDPRRAFNQTLEDLAVTEMPKRAWSDNNTSEASREFFEIIKGIDRWNNKCNNIDQFDGDNLVITPVQELKKLYERETNKIAYLKEANIEKAIEVYKEHHLYPELNETFRAGVDWAKHNLI